MEVEDDLAKANLFKVNEKIIIPVILGRDNLHATVNLQIPYSILGKQEFNVKLLYPGEKTWEEMGTKKYAEKIRLNIPLQRGCALISIE